MVEVNSPPTALEAGNPFPGPRPYAQDQKELFFGRGNEIDELTSLVLSTSAVLLYAPSGSGKSSLLQAGLVPALKDFGCQVLPTVRFGRIGIKPPDGAADAPPQNPFVKLVCDTVLPQDAPASQRRDLGDLTAHLHRQEGASFTLLVLDQFEELFVNQALWQERGEFLAQLRRALDASPWLHAVLAIRSDYLANLLPHERDMPGRMLLRYGLESLSERAARQAIDRAFCQTGQPLTPAELDRVLDRLLNLDVGVPGSRVRGQYVNLIQLQIFCRRLWREKAESGRAGEPGAANDSQLLQGSDVNLADYMQSFVDDAVASVVAQTQCDVGIVRRWLEDRLTTPGGRRAVLLVDSAQTSGLPEGILRALENARLIQVEQRNQSQWAELTHDSMVAAVQASNAAWGKTRLRTRLRRTAVFAVAFAVLAALFPLLLLPTNQPVLARVSGYLTAKSATVPFPQISQGGVVVVEVDLNGTPGAGATISLESKDKGKQQFAVQSAQPVGAGRNVEVNTTVSFAISTAQSTSYAVAIKAPNWKSASQTSLRYFLTVQPAPVLMDLSKPGTAVSKTINSPMAVVKLYPGQPVYLNLGADVSLEDLPGVQTILTDADQIGYVVESASAGYAVLSTDDTYGDDGGDGVQGVLIKQGPALSIGGHTRIRTDSAAVESVNVAEAKAPFGVETSCTSGYESLSTLLDSGGAPVTSAVKSVPEGSILAPVGHGSKYRLVLLADPDGNGVNCQVAVRSFADQAITTMREHSIGIDATSPYNAYPIRLPTDSVIIVPGLNGTHASLNCPEGQVTEAGSQRLLAFVPAHQNCVLSVEHSSRQAGKPASYVLLIDQVTGGGG